MVYFTSDPHLGHNKEFLYKPRGFESSVEHDAAFVDMWNHTVKPEDIVYVLGDLVVGELERGYESLRQLNPCELHIIIGNHDSNTKIGVYRAIFGLSMPIICFADERIYHKQHIYLSHYPTITTNLDDNIKPLKALTINFHGHTHSQEPFYNDSPLCFNVGLDAHQNRLITIDEALDACRKKYQEALDKTAIV